MHWRTISIGLAVIAFGGMFACGGKVGDAVRPTEFTGAGANGGAAPVCSGAPRYASPLVVDLDSDSRLHLEAAMKKGVTVVNYDCVNLKVLANCRIADGTYEYAGASKRERVVQMKSQDDLSVNLPLSAGKLGAEVQSGRSIDLALVSIGLRSTTVEKVGKTELVGSCDGATHIVQTATLGAFSMATGSAGKAKAVAELFSVGASGASQSSRNTSTTDGNLEACRKADPDSNTPPAECRAPISLQLLPVADATVPDPTPIGPNGKKEEKPASPQQNPCRDGYVLANGICSKATADKAHVCDPKNTDECKAQCELGSMESCYNYGLTFKQYTGGRPFFKKACDGGVPDGCALAARSFYEVESADHNAAVIKEMKSSCLAGSKPGCTFTGDLLVGYLSGFDQQKRPNAAEGVKFYERGCSLGSDESCGSLGQLYLEGIQVTKDEKKAYALLDRACAGKEALSCSVLAKTFSSAEAGPLRNNDRAFRAAAFVCPDLKGISCDEAVQVGIDTGHPKEALTWATEACAAWPYNCGKVGDMYSEGIGTAKDPAKAKEFWTKACGNGEVSRKACEKIGFKKGGAAEPPPAAPAKKPRGGKKK